MHKHFDKYRIEPIVADKDIPDSFRESMAFTIINPDGYPSEAGNLKSAKRKQRDGEHRQEIDRERQEGNFDVHDI